MKGLLLYLHFDELNSVFTTTEDGDIIFSVFESFSSIRYMTKYAIDKTGNCLIFGAFWERMGEVIIHISDRCLWADNVGSWAFFDDESFFCIVFVLDFSHQLLDDILERDDASRLTVFIGHDSHLYMKSLEILQELFNFLTLWCEMCWTHELMEVHSAMLFESGEEVFQIDDSHDIIEVVSVNWYTRVAFSHNNLEVCFEIFIYIERKHTTAWNIYLTNGSVIKFKHILNQFI